MWEEYFSEIIGAETLAWEEGFVCFQELPDSLFIQHFYVKKEFRRGEAVVRMMAKLKERAAGKTITACLDQTNKNWQESLKAQLNAGFKISAVSGTVVYTYLSHDTQGEATWEK